MTEEQPNVTKKKRYACATCGEEYTDVEDAKCPFDGTQLTPIAEELVPGAVLGGRFVIIEAISGGAMGKIYKARHQLMKRTIAIKTILPHLVASGAALKRFQQEAEALSSLSHPHILSVFDFFIAEDGQPYLVMDYLEGTNLEQVRTTSGAISPERVVHIFTQVCDALFTAHQAGIIHRDIKPSNIMLVKAGNDPDYVKVIDFGIAKIVVEGEGGSGENLTATGDTFGTPQFMSPEQCRAKPPDARSDIYSLGCVMYTALTGQPPFSAEDPMQCMYKQVNDEPPPFPESLDIPAALREVVSRAMQKDPDKRFHNMEDMGMAIAACSLAFVVPTAAETAKKLRRPIWHYTAAVSAVVVMIAGVMTLIQVLHNQTRPTPRPAYNPGPIPVAQPAPTPTTQSEPAATYASDMENGKKNFAVGNYIVARKFFNDAHKLAEEEGGEADPRYLESMEWQGKCALKLGDLALAKQAFTYIVAVLKEQGQGKSSRMKEVESNLAAANRALKSR